MVEAFIHAQQHPYYDRLINGIGRSFAELIKHGKLVEEGIQSGKIKITMEQGQAGTSHRKPKKENKMAVVYPDSGQYAPVNFIQQPAPPPPRYQQAVPVYQQPMEQPCPFTPQQQGYHQNPPQHAKIENFQRKKLSRAWVFAPLAESQSSIMGKLLAQGAITLIPAGKTPDPLPKSYDHSRRCEYHSGMVGHSTDDCFSLKHKI